MAKNPPSQGSAQRHPKYSVTPPGSVDRFAQFTADDVKKVAEDLKGSPMGVGLRRQNNFSKLGRNPNLAK